MLISALSLALGYLLGSIPFGLLLTRAAGTADLRNVGSGNIGATNVLRTGRKDLAAATLLLDALKASAAYLIGAAWGAEGAGLAAAVGAFLGHLYPVWLGFKGGKGVATYLGGLLAACWPAGLAFIGVWLFTAYLTRYSSASALLASLAAPLVAYELGQGHVAATFALLAALLWLKHAANISRLWTGTESRIGAKA